jgi:hypothetical protein
MYPLLIDDKHPTESHSSELSLLEDRQQAAYPLSYAAVPQTQVQQLQYFRHTHASRQLYVDDACWEYLLGGQGKEVVLLLPGWPCIAEWNFERIQALERRYIVLSPSAPIQVSMMAHVVRGLVSIL